jgi:hypothetical protein
MIGKKRQQQIMENDEDLNQIEIEDDKMSLVAPISEKDQMLQLSDSKSKSEDKL